MRFPTYRIVISDKIKEYRKKHHLTQAYLAILLGVSPQAISKWEKELCYPDIIFLPRLAQVFGCRIDDFFENDKK